MPSAATRRCEVI